MRMGKGRFRGAPPAGHKPVFQEFGKLLQATDAPAVSLGIVRDSLAGVPAITTEERQVGVVVRHGPTAKPRYKR